jgi:hypothetical protein
VSYEDRKFWGLLARMALTGLFVLAVFFSARSAQAASLGGVTPPLAAKARQIVQACGARVISGVRHTRVAGSRRLSLHASGRAVDLAGNPRCIYAHLRGWAGGFSTDYSRVRHVHVSYGGREHGRRFAHRASRASGCRHFRCYASRGWQ